MNGKAFLSEPLQKNECYPVPTREYNRILQFIPAEEGSFRSGPEGPELEG